MTAITVHTPDDDLDPRTFPPDSSVEMIQPGSIRGYPQARRIWNLVGNQPLKVVGTTETGLHLRAERGKEFVLPERLFVFSQRVFTDRSRRPTSPKRLLPPTNNDDL